MRRVVMLVLISLAVVACGSDSKTSTTQAVGSSSGGTAAALPGEPAGTKTYTNLPRNHVDTPVEYPQTPPVGGNHSPVWQDCQYYDTSVPNERAVHSLEHGAVWITYSPDTSAADREVLKALAATGDHILVSEYKGLPSPIVATAWGKQLLLPSVNDPRLQQFVDFFQSGPQTPELGVTCRNSTNATT
ncbi:MAG TPA: DUF3105 domain-containing protein [Ilumatobacteraceae bacterium]|jgi:hypothetical protein